MEKPVANKVVFNKRLCWDYDIKEDDLKQEDVLILYISKVLSHGTLRDVQGIPVELVLTYLPRLYLPRQIRRFWEWHLGISRDSEGNP